MHVKRQGSAYYDRSEMPSLPAGMQGREGKWTDGFLRYDGKRHQGGESCPSFLGRTMYFREGRFRCRLFCRLYPSVCLLSEPRDRSRADGSGDQPFTPGAENINLVTPSHYADKIIQAIRMAKERGFDLPFVYNCGGYEKVKILKQLDGLIDIYLTDFKYMSAESAMRYSSAKDYPKVAKAALDEMMRQQPQTIYDGHGMLKRGVLVRHLLLPSHRKEAEQVVRYVYGTYKNRAALSLMCQYTPLEDLDAYPELKRRVTKREYEKLLDFAVELGVENGYMQEMESARKSYIPPFDGKGVVMQ